MIVLDTNVLSELTKPAPDEAVLLWFAQQANSDLHTTSVTRAEMRLGVALMPDGQRRERVSEANDRYLAWLAPRTLAFDSAAADHYATVVSDRIRGGNPISSADAQIAAIARAHRATVATRNVDDFRDTGVRIVDPFDPAGGL